MPRIHDIDLPPALEDVLLKWLQYMPNEDAIALQNCLQGGFTKPGTIRERIKALIQSPAVLPGWLLKQLQFSLPACEIVEGLSVQELRVGMDELAKAAGVPQFLLALVADERVEVQQLAVARMATVGNPAKEEESSVDSADVVRPEMKVLEKRDNLNELKTKLEKERTARAEDRRRLMAAAKAEQARLALDIRQRDQQIQQLSGQSESLEKELANSRRTTAEAIQSGIHAELAAMERRWLSDAIALDSLAAANSSADLLSRVESTLASQKRQDRHSGNRMELQEKLQALRTASQRLRDARQNAFHPIRELAEVAEEVDQETARVELKLGIPTSADGVAERLIARINESADMKALQECSTLLDSLDEQGLLAADQSRRLYEALQRRHGIMAAAVKQGGADTQIHWLSLPTLVHRNLDSRLLLDGHNVLFAMHVLAPYFEDGKPGKKARDRLVELMQRLLGSRSKVHAQIVFDSPEESEITIADNLKVVYSGGSGDQRADDAIVRHLSQKSLQNLKLRTFVVTNDRHLQSRIRHNQAHYMPVGAFDVMLRHFECLQ